MKRRKHLFAMLAMLLLPLTAHAQGKSLFITFNDNTRVEFALSSNPEISFADDMLTVKAGDQSSSYELKKVQTFTYGTSTGIRKVEGDAEVSMEGNRIVVRGQNARIRIFAIDGKAVNMPLEKTGDYQVVDVDMLPKGVYIVNVNGKSIKITRK
ncbi:MAG: T9SS type A sorting domain-containing protein [Prevotella sp.]|nr:T9SS type A sorting domain-containing protein [Prevotella sp.]